MTRKTIDRWTSVGTVVELDSGLRGVVVASEDSWITHSCECCSDYDHTILDIVLFTEGSSYTRTSVSIDIDGDWDGPTFFETDETMDVDKMWKGYDWVVYPIVDHYRL